MKTRNMIGYIIGGFYGKNRNMMMVRKRNAALSHFFKQARAIIEGRMPASLAGICHDYILFHATVILILISPVK